MRPGPFAPRSAGRGGAVPTFEYVAIRPDGARLSGTLAAASEQAVLAELDGKKFLPVRVREVKSAAAQQRALSPRVLGETYGQLGDLLRAGVPMLRALALMSRRKSRPRLAAVFAKIAEQVGDGAELSAALEQQPGVFPRVHVAMVRAGERGGFLEDVLRRLGVMVIGQAKLNEQVRGNLMYPAIVSTVGTVVVGLIFGVFVPMFRTMFERVENLPGITVFVFGLSEWVTRFGPLLAAGLVAGGVVAWPLRRRDDVRRWLSIARTKAWVVGPLTRTLATARFCRLLGTMEANGVPMLAALQIAREAAGNTLMERAIDGAIESVRAGGQLAPALAQSGLFADDVIEMVMVGEAAGNVDEVLLNVAATLEDRVERQLGAAVKLIEPALLIAIALAVVTVAAAILLPLTQMTADL